MVTIVDRKSVLSYAAAAVLFIGSIGCSGSIESPSGPNGPGRGGNGGTNPDDPVVAKPGGSSGSPDSLALLEGRVWRLTRVQYNNAVADLVGDDTAPADRFLAEEGGTGFVNAEQNLGFSSTNMDEFSRAALKLAAETVGDSARLGAIWPCAADTLDDDSCAERFVSAFGRRAFRRPLTDPEKERYLAIYTDAKAALDAETAVQLLIEGFLQSPNFLFRKEVGVEMADGKGRKGLTAHEVAEQLSFYLWDTIPDSELDALADDGTLLTKPGALREQAKRLLGNDRARPVFQRMFSQMFGVAAIDELSKGGEDSDLFQQRKAEMLEEVNRFVSHALWEDSASFETLLTAPYSVATAGLAELYGAQAPSEDWKPIFLDGDHRAGILTLPALMAVTSHADRTSPILRGKAITEHVLCVEIADPPPDLMVEDLVVDTTKPARERAAQRAQSPICSACHQLLDPPGFAFEHLDWMGRLRTEEKEGVPVDTSGEILAASDANGPFKNIRELAETMAKSSQARDCLSRHVFRYAGGRKEGKEDKAAINEMMAGFGENGWNVKDLLLSHVTSDRFIYRKAD